MGWQQDDKGNDPEWPVIFDPEDFREGSKFDWAKLATFLILAGALVCFWAVVVLAVFHLVTG